MAYNEIASELNKAIKEKCINRRRIEDVESAVAEEIEAPLRSFLKKKLPGTTIDQLQAIKLSNGQSILSTLAKNHLLPDDLKVSQRIRQSTIQSDCGRLSIIPQEVLTHMIFKRLTIEEASSVVTVSKSWLKAITSDHIWSSQVESTASAPYFALLKRIIYSRYLKRQTYFFGVEVDVVDGEGLLEHESGNVQGLKLNGKPIIASWNDNAGSIARCLTRSKILTKEDISHITSTLESYLNAPLLDVSVLDEKLMPFLKCLQSGTYKINVQKEEHFISPFFYTTFTDLDSVEWNYADTLQVYTTQPRDSLNQSRVAYYVEQIKKGARPAVLTIKLDWNVCFLIDGHHKFEAYCNAKLSEEIPFIHIEPIDFPDIPRQEEFKYVAHSGAASESYHNATDFLYPNK